MAETKTELILPQADYDDFESDGEGDIIRCLDPWLFALQLGPYQLLGSRLWPHRGPCADHLQFAQWRCEAIRIGIRRSRSQKYHYEDDDVVHVCLGGIFSWYHGPSHVTKRQCRVVNKSRIAKLLGHLLVRVIVVARNWREELSCVVNAALWTGDPEFAGQTLDLDHKTFTINCPSSHLGVNTGEAFDLDKQRAKDPSIDSCQMPSDYQHSFVDYHLDRSASDHDFFEPITTSPPPPPPTTTATTATI